MVRNTIRADWIPDQVRNDKHCKAFADTYTIIRFIGSIRESLEENHEYFPLYLRPIFSKGL
jgi:hypothetical protein